MRVRHTARVLLLDPADRVLLMRARPTPQSPAYWFTVGGEIEPGETLLAAAAREIVEETGFTDAELGAVPWRDEFVLRIGADGGEDTQFKQHYVIAHTNGGAPSKAGWLAHEHALTEELRWWTLAEIVEAAEVIYPLGFAELLADVLAGRIAAEPLLIHTLEGPVRPLPRPPRD